MKSQQNNDQWKTNNQSYGEHAQQVISQQSLKQKTAVSTLQALVKQDPSNFVHHIQNVSKRQRHGLFTQPPPLAVGDKYADKKPDQVKRNISVNPRLQDHVQPQLFSRLGSTNLGDPYKDPFRAGQLYDKEKNDLVLSNQAFKPTQTRKTIKHSEFQHQKQYDDKVYNTRDENGKVVTGKRNFSTNPMKKGYGAANTGHLFGQYEYIPSEYDAQRQKQIKQKAQHKAKIKAPFISASQTKSVFTPDHNVHAKQVDDPYKQIKPEKADTHYGPWKATNPSKKGYQKTFEKFPVYIEQGEKPKQTTQGVRPWIHNFNGTSKNQGQTLSKPCPVPSQMVLNELRRNK